MDLSLRPATRDDLDAIISIVLAAMPSDPRWLYRFPHAKQYPDEHEKYERLRYLNYFERINDGACSIMLAEISEKESSRGRKPIAISIWQLPGSHIPGHPSNKVVLRRLPMFHDRRDANAVHVKEFRETVKVAKKVWFNDVFGQQQLNLLRLATHPDYQRQGAGTLLIQWGLAKANEQKLAVTLFSSPMGERLYTSLGFHEVGRVHVHVASEKTALDFPGMVYESGRLSV